MKMTATVTPAIASANISMIHVTILTSRTVFVATYSDGTRNSIVHSA